MPTFGEAQAPNNVGCAYVKVARRRRDRDFQRVLKSAACAGER